MGGHMKKVKTEPIDLKQCQAEKPNETNFMTMGGFIGGLVRCTNVPRFIASGVGTDGIKGKMSLCTDCLAVAEKQLGKKHFKIKEI